MKTTLDLPDDLMREAKIRAATQGKKLKDIMADAIRSGFSFPPVAPIKTLPLVISHTASGFSYIKCNPNSEKPAVTFEELQRVIVESQLEEDLQRAGIPH
jgi:hypothetical protein